MLKMAAFHQMMDELQLSVSIYDQNGILQKITLNMTRRQYFTVLLFAVAVAVFCFKPLTISLIFYTLAP